MPIFVRMVSPHTLPRKKLRLISEWLYLAPFGTEPCDTGAGLRSTAVFGRIEVEAPSKVNAEQMSDVEDEDGVVDEVPGKEMLRHYFIQSDYATIAGSQTVVSTS
jgi:hypothetical protein